MKLNVPFYKQTTTLNCGPAALRIVLAYIDKDPGIEILEQKTELKEGKGIMTIQIATAAALLGHPTKFFSKHIEFNPENKKLEFYKKYTTETQQSDSAVKNARRAGVQIEKRTLSLKEILAAITEDSVPIILLDWNVISPKEGRTYQGHFVPVVGYDENNIYVHNHGLVETQAYFPIPKDIFEKARKARGTDEDITIISKK